MSHHHGDQSRRQTDLASEDDRDGVCVPPTYSCKLRTSLHPSVCAYVQRIKPRTKCRSFHTHGVANER